MFGVAIVNGAGMQVPVRDVGEQHVKEDLGRIPTAQDWLLQITPQPCKVDFKIVDGSALVGKSRVASAGIILPLAQCARDLPSWDWPLITVNEP